jgi:hypothetical protein
MTCCGILKLYARISNLAAPTGNCETAAYAEE